MKNLIILIIVLFSCNCFYSQNINDPFVGIWEWQNGNQTFRVELFIDEDEDIGGHYKLTENVNGIEVTIYNSDKPLGFGLTWGRTIYGGSDGTILEAGIDDNTIPRPIYGTLSGHLTMEIQPIAGIGQVTATWKVVKMRGLKFDNDNREFNIPTDIVLTKVQ